MKITFFDNEHGSNFEMFPETVEDVAALARMANNTKADKPVINFYFSGTPSGNIWIKKVARQNQKNYLSNSKSS